MFSAFVPWCAETCISAHESEGKKPHQGVATKKSAHLLGHELSNSTTALGLRGEAALNRIRSRCTGKKRDTETSLDYFGARYYSNGLGRWISADWSATPVPVPYTDLNDPQSLNLYGYVRNIPTVTIDADGHCEEDDCSAIQVTAEVTRPATMKEMRVLTVDVASVQGQVTYTFMYNNKPLTDTLVHEDVTNTQTINGQKADIPTTTGDDKTDSQGQVYDASGVQAKTLNADPSSNKAADYLSQNVIQKDTLQTLTVTSPNGCTCTVTETRTLTNAGPGGTPSSQYTLKVTSPRVQTAKPAKKPPAKRPKPPAKRPKKKKTEES